jgi:hypothetical protein
LDSSITRINDKLMLLNSYVKDKIGFKIKSASFYRRASTFPLLPAMTCGPAGKVASQK